MASVVDAVSLSRRFVSSAYNAILVGDGVGRGMTLMRMLRQMLKC